MQSTASSPNSQIIQRALAVFIIIVIAVALWIVRDILMLTLTGVIFAILLRTPIRFFVKRGIPRPLAIMLTLTLLILVLIATVLLLLPGLFGQCQQLISIYIPGAMTQLQGQLQADTLTARFPVIKDIDQKTRAYLTD